MTKHKDGDNRWIKWDRKSRRNVDVAEGTPGATEFFWSEAIGRWITVPVD